MVSGASSVTARLGAEITAHRLQFDGAQLTAARHLDALGAALQMETQSFSQRLRGVLPWLARKASSPQGVYLWGGVGRGKTLLMDYFVESVPVRVQRSHFYHFMRDVHAELAEIKGQTDPLDLIAQRWADRSRLLCLDEFFVSDIADAMILAGLFEGLFRRNVVLVTTSNVQPQDLYKDGLQRQRFLPAIELLRTQVDVIHLDGGIDYRLRQLEQAPTYLDSHLPETSQALSARFAALTGGPSSAATTLTIEGRALCAVAASQEAAWFEFRELCDGPRSQYDYIELARRYHTIFISNIPTFAVGDDNSARRFIMLIDELYDRGVKIVVSAAALPTALYRGERLQFEFERAASRLVEMQTQRYLAAQHRAAT